MATALVNGSEQPSPGGRLRSGDPWPLTGRVEEVQAVESALSDSELSGIIVSGAAGVGKTRIAREALSIAAAKGSETRWIAATSSARTLPLGAFEAWVPSGVTDNLHLVRGVIDALTDAPEDTALVVAVDDVHLLDDLSTFVLHQLVQRGAAKIVLTMRDGEPVAPGLQEVWKAGRFDRLAVQPLADEETAQLLSATLGGAIDAVAAHRLWKLTRGNPLYLRNIVEHEKLDRRLVEQHGQWSWSGDLIVPPGLVDLIETRIGAMSPSVGDVVDLVSIAEPIELSVLTRLVDSAAVEDAELRDLITLEHVDDAVQVWLAHPLYGEVRRKRAPVARLRRLRGLVTAELATSEDRDDRRVLVRRATLSLDSDLQPDADLLTGAARAAVWLIDLPLADRLAHAAIHAGGGLEASLVCAFVLSWLGRGSEAEDLLSRVPTGGLTGADLARLAFLRATNSIFTLADPTGAKTIIDNAAQTVPRRDRACVDAFLAVYWALIGKPDAVRDAMQDVDLHSLPDVAARVASWAVALAAGQAGQTARAAVAAEAGYPLQIRAFVSIIDAHVGALVLAGEIQAARDRAEWLEPRAAAVPWAAQLVVAPAKGRAALGAGRLCAACSLLRPVVDTFAASREANGYGYRYRLSLATALAMRGLTNDARAELGALEQQWHPAWRCLDYERELAGAWVAASQGAVSEAAETALAAGATARTNGQFAAEVICLQTATQFGDHSSGPRLRELAKLVEGPRAAIAATFADALQAGDGAELISVSKQFETMGDLVAAVDAAAHAATSYRGKGLRGSALSCSARADELAEQCGGASTPALRQASEQLPLTEREREIVQLIGQGLSNRELAERLTLSVRTVESHIYRAMAKTGVGSRDELAMLIPPRGSGELR
jgi:DNA-binding CsgD family transcriptional regulator